jgi:hypothetical protein
MATAILVAGMHRSGTSATAGALRLYGVDLGTELLSAGSDNRLGYWEHARVVAIHEQLLAELERGWDDVRDLPPGWLDCDAARIAEGQIHQVIESEFASSLLWAVKDPRICRFLPLWKRVLSRRGISMTTLLVARRPSEVAASIHARNEWMPALSEMLWMRHVFDAERDSRDGKRCVITYDELVSHPDRAITRALARLEVISPGTAASPERAIAHFVSENERHHRHTDEPVEMPQTVARQAYDLLAKVAEDNDGWDAIGKLGRTFAESELATSPYIAALADWAAKFRSREARAIERIHQVSSDLNAQNAWSVKAVEREQKLQEEVAKANSSLNAQIIWSEQAVERECALRERLSRYEVTMGRQILEIAVGAAERDKLAATAAELQEQKQALEAQLACIMNSLSWRVSKPIRWMGRLLRG